MKCILCGANCDKDYCFKHKPRKPLNKTRINSYTNQKGIDEIDKALEKELMWRVFLVLWKKRGAMSEISGEKLYSPVSSAYFHHILPKEKYKFLELNEDNIILLTIDEHNNVENNMYKYEEINKRRESLKLKYKIF